MFLCLYFSLYLFVEFRCLCSSTRSYGLKPLLAGYGHILVASFPPPALTRNWAPFQREKWAIEFGFSGKMIWRHFYGVVHAGSCSCSFMRFGFVPTLCNRPSSPDYPLARSSPLVVHLCIVHSSKCKIQSVKCKMQSAKCKMQIASCKVQSGINCNLYCAVSQSLYCVLCALLARSSSHDSPLAFSCPSQPG